MTIQNNEERKVLKEAGKHLAHILATLESELVPGMETREIDARTESLIRELGDKPALKNYHPRFAARPYPSTICVSVNDEVVHGIPTENNLTLKEGDTVGLDLVIIHEGMFVDSALTVPVGKIDENTEALLTVTHDALIRGIEYAVAGNRVGDISSAIEDVGVAHGYGVVYELGGHGVGSAVHEEPMIPNVGDPGTGPVLKEGMVIAIEPMFNEGTADVVLDPDGYTYRTKDGSRSAHFEHTVIVGKEMPEILTLRS